MNEPDIIGYVAGTFITILVIGVSFFILFVPQIDRFFQKLKKKHAARRQLKESENE